jgi:hypothetical protein
MDVESALLRLAGNLSPFPLLSELTLNIKLPLNTELPVDQADLEAAYRRECPKLASLILSIENVPTSTPIKVSYRSLPSLY